MRPAAVHKMLVEGNEDKFAVIQLMGHHIEWSDRKEDAPVQLELGGSAEEILATGFITGKLKASDINTLGVVFDADDQFAGRWARILALCKGHFQGIPDQMPIGGLILQNNDGQRFGVWIMPDNASHGMLETFLRYLVPTASEPLWLLAQKAHREAVGMGAQCKECHTDKALVHTWLAWQDPPGQALGLALTRKILDPNADAAKPFVSWFKELYGL